MKLSPEDKVLIQGINEPLAAVHAVRMKAYGTNVVAGVSPGEGGQTLDGIPIFDLVEQAVSEMGTIATTMIFVPPYLALDAALEAIAADIHQIIIITQGVPPLDMVCLLRKAEATNTLVVGPNSLGIIVPGKILLGTYPVEFYSHGSVGMISRSDTLTSEVALELTKAELGQSICVSIGNDTIIGSSLLEWLTILNEDKNTKAIVLVSQIDDGIEETAVQYIKEKLEKPVIAYVAGRLGPPRKRQLHASDLIVSLPILGTDPESTESIIASFRQAKIPIADRPSQVPELIKKALKIKT
ncbi:CoA-binding protein [Aerosakkonemataceae cyanobacterium BLCC-F154]|uniref:CoA-binding protein n=1 Tax=Floridaenema fluviatile BLCC-F154 TaxID=3153640 RepID=A0ABV4YB61_9CYAN